MLQSLSPQTIMAGLKLLLLSLSQYGTLAAIYNA